MNRESKILCKSLALLIVFFISHKSNSQTNPVDSLTISFNKPARYWEEYLPLGNGRLGMMPGGRITKETITLNDITLWSGQEQDANNYAAYKSLPKIRELLFKGKNEEAQQLVDKEFVCTGPGSGSGNGANEAFGCYQVLGNLHLQFNYGNNSDSVTVKKYNRTLSIGDAVATVKYQINGINYTREYFTSFDDDIGIIRISADKPRKINCQLSLDRPERFQTEISHTRLHMYGQLNNGTDGMGMKYSTWVGAQLKEGKLVTGKDNLIIKNATELTIYFSSKTNYNDEDFEKISKSILEASMKKSYSEEKASHIHHYQKLFNRVKLSLGSPTLSKLSTPARLKAFQLDPSGDNGLAVLFYQYGRYLSISSTRLGLLPPNLQGLWAHKIQTPWNGDYHLDVNVQMNHWPLEVSNLSELNLPLTDMIRRMVPNGEKTAKAYYNADGWVAHVITNPWSFTEPGESASWGAAKSGSGWLCNNLWQHYAFTNDIEYLKSVYPILKGSALFYNSMLVTDPESGWLVTSPSSSPENTFYLPNGNTASICMGPTLDNQIIRELFNHVIEASKILDTDDDFRDTLTNQITKLPPVGRIGKDGTLMEWLKDYTSTNPHHRHISHLYGLFPASLITPESTPALARACIATLNARGDDGPGWSIAYKQIFWARLHDGNRAFKLFTQLMRPRFDSTVNYGPGGGIYPNLFSAGPPYQIDGNFGGETGIAEMLLQSHAGFIDLVPALPDAWKKSGMVSGLKARGGFEVDMNWEDGKIVSYRIASKSPKTVKIRVNGEFRDIVSEQL